ncbi:MULTISPECIES: response regulator transcription factor [unclassified Duganella]|uniref:response regulator transcription factor n=1 Tax=unclassified Duganella TaxID=2636909 RepID=UPI000E34A389|nr:MULTISPECIES: response regulator transcription factor [unclassified Duganella]RFP18836.1 DNA-binding response regulator [Duganella sp. BJB475]RFP35501.1 DNA-binding response regulator [Duganella sp. BJB476]
MRLDTRNWPHTAIGGNLANQDIKVRVLIAHSDAIVNAGLAALLGAESDMQVTPDAAQPHPVQADVIILDHKGALEHMRQQANTPQHGEAPARVLIVTQMDREWEVRTAMMAGVHGYLLQSCAADQLPAAVRALSRGLRYLSADLSRCVADSFTRVGLTSRETDVLQLLAQGQCNKSIARELGIGVGTVKTHVKGLFDKLGATARTHAVVLATRRGLVGEGAIGQH